MRNTISLFVITLLTTFAASGQNVKLLTSDQKLSNSLITNIYQDAHGYIWICTEDGLNRFDGIHNTTYRNNASDSTTIGSNYVHCVYEDRKQHFWIGCINGLQLFDRATETFTNIKLTSEQELIHPHIVGVVETSDGKIWAATSGRGLLLIDPDKREGQQIKLRDNSDESIFLSAIMVDDNDMLWLTSQNEGAYRYDTYKQILSKIESTTLSFDQSSLAKDEDGNIYMGVVDAGFLQYNPKSGKFETIDKTASVSSLAAKGKHIYIGTDGEGLKTYDTNTRTIEPVNIYTPEIDFAKAKIHSVVFDNNGNLWLGIFQKGVMMVPYSPSHFNNYGYRPNNSYYNIGSGCVMSLMTAGKTLWIGADNDGLYHMGEHGETLEHYTNLPKTIMNMLPVDDHTMLIASYTSGLASLDTKSGKCTYMNDRLTNAYPQFSNRAVTLCRDAANRIWLGTYGNGVFCLDGQQTLHYMSTSETVDLTRSELSNNWVNSICNDAESRVWFATFKGASCINAQTKRFIDLGELGEILRDKIVYDIMCDSNGNMWFGTSNGLIVNYTSTQTIKHYTMDDGLPSNTIVAIVEDNGGQVWVSTLYGISCHNPATCKFSNYYSHNGLQGDEYSRCAVAIADDGKLYFGGTKGISSFYPNHIENNNAECDVAITHFFLYDVEKKKGDITNGYTIMDKATIDADTFTISYYDKSFGLEFCTFNYTNPERLKYEYMLQGFSNEWNCTQAGMNGISFTNLKPGTYTLYIRAINGTIASNTRIITIIIMPAWFQTWWAKTLYAIIFAALIAMLMLIFLQQMKLRNEQIKRNQEEQINEAKFQFFFNISHEIRTPLTLIINPINRLLDTQSTPELHSNYVTIHRNAMRILRLINQLLDIRKIDKGLMAMHFVHTDIIAFIADIKHSFDDFAHDKNIEFEMETTQSSYTADIDRNHFDKVIINILSNAFKFTPDNGEVKITTECNDKNIIIKILDSGIGIDDSQTEKIFDRFYQIESQQSASFKGTGIGLHLSKSIVDIHHGTIKATKRTDKQGSLFTVTIPTHQAVLEPTSPIAEITNYEAETEVAAQQTNSEPLTCKRPSTNYRLLVVDDEQEVNDFLVQELSRTCKITSCRNGREAYVMLLKQQFDIVVSDVMMPEMDGITLCHKIKNNANICHVPVILLTAKVADEDKTHGIAIGADAYIEKPFNIELLRNTITTTLANRERIRNNIVGNDDRDKQMKDVELKSADEALMEKIMQYLNDNMSDSNLSVETMASSVGLSRVHLHRKLKALTSMSARDFIRTYRLKQAGKLLASKKLNVSDVAYSLGFSNLSHFSNTFKDFYGMSPSEYMAKHRDENTTDEA